jgi:site-specific DNA recombinase
MLGIYCRTSKNRAEKFTIDNQREAGIDCAAKLGIGFRVYLDDGISGTLDESVRDGLSDLFRDIRKGEITHVYCIDQSRIERDTRTWDFFVAECLNNEIKYYPGGSFFDLDSGTNRMFAKLMSIVNAYYSEITSKKVRIANAKKASEGKTHGLKPYGYKKGKDNKYEIYEIEAKNVRRMFQLSLDGIGAYSIANRFNAEGIPTKFSGNFTGEITRKDKYTKNKTKFKKGNVKWRGNVISDMLNNKMYKGVREWNRYEDVVRYENDKLVKDKVAVELIINNDIPVIIDPELWDAVNKNLVHNRKNVGRKEHYHYLLNGLIICSHCKNEIIGKKRLKGSDNAYKCKGKRPPHNNCEKSRGISLPKLETFIIQHLFESRQLKKLLVEAPKNGTEALRLKKVKVQKEKQKSDLNKSVTRLAGILKDRDLEEDENFTLDYKANKKKLQEVESEIESLTVRISEIENNSRSQRSKSLIEHYAEDVGFDELKKLVHSLIEKIEIHHQTESKSGFFTLNVKYRFYDEESLFVTDWQAMKWHWVAHYRKEAFTGVQMKEDKDLREFMNKGKVKKPGKKVQFKGYESYSSMSEIVNLKKEEFIMFD